MCCPQAARAFLCLGLPGKQLMPVLGRCPSRTPGRGGRTAVCPSSRRRERRGESTALIHSWDPSAWLCALCSASFSPPAVGSSVSPLQCPCRVQSVSSRRTPAPAREAVVLPALGTPRAGLLRHPRQTALALPSLAPVECCNLPVDGSFGPPAAFPAPAHLRVGVPTPPQRRPAWLAPPVWGRAVWTRLGPRMKLSGRGRCFSSTESTALLSVQDTPAPGRWMTGCVVQSGPGGWDRTWP